MKKPKLYLSGPMSNVKDLNKPLFNKRAKELRAKGYKVVNPPELDFKEPKRTWEDCLRRDLTYVVECDAVATLPNWRKSRGALLEIYVAKALSMPVHSVEHYLRRSK